MSATEGAVGYVSATDAGAAGLKVAAVEVAPLPKAVKGAARAAIGAL